MKFAFALLIVLIGLFQGADGTSSTSVTTGKSSTSTTTKATSTVTSTTERTTLSTTTTKTTPTTSRSSTSSSTTRRTTITTKTSSPSTSRTMTTVKTTQSTITRPSTTSRPYPTGVYCYRCSEFFCPNPFSSSSVIVDTAYAASGWCQKSSATESQQSSSSRGAADFGQCTSTGCSWKTKGITRTWVCCCNRSYCNAGISSLRSSVVPLLLSLFVIFFLGKAI